MYVGGAPARARHCRFVCQVPEGQYNDAAVTAAMTQAVVEAEDGSWPDPQRRRWVFTNEVEDGTWGGLGGKIVTLPNIPSSSSAATVAGWPSRCSLRADDRRAEVLLAAAGERAAA
jgi:hypothetical protein